MECSVSDLHPLTAASARPASTARPARPACSGDGRLTQANHPPGSPGRFTWWARAQASQDLPTPVGPVMRMLRHSRRHRAEARERMRALSRRRGCRKSMSSMQALGCRSLARRNRLVMRRSSRRVSSRSASRPKRSSNESVNRPEDAQSRGPAKRTSSPVSAPVPAREAPSGRWPPFGCHKTDSALCLARKGSLRYGQVTVRFAAESATMTTRHVRHWRRHPHSVSLRSARSSHDLRDTPAGEGKGVQRGAGRHEHPRRAPAGAGTDSGSHRPLFAVGGRLHRCMPRVRRPRRQPAPPASCSAVVSSCRDLPCRFTRWYGRHRVPAR